MPAESSDKPAEPIVIIKKRLIGLRRHAMFNLVCFIED
jgi:hypothetical protein